MWPRVIQCFGERQLHCGMVPQQRKANGAKCGSGSKTSSSSQVAYTDLLLLVSNFLYTYIWRYIYIFKVPD